ncbi:hypothetical protein OD91_0395 [Lutibacter sp. Hel_I_33_5]|uniref:hypothetical protein n=1 Tax=Lutibacter sp. Hel_I_33_5 TaxID=1566289 RepID=UPI0011A7DE20|nr:hypothetical protein [Lutibacter sp. Hel_I_33_5]TVZ55151.1 hypothetical protein OD91_0395 [Lutibacter sp. Hel_I_33_5]
MKKQILLLVILFSLNGTFGQDKMKVKFSNGEVMIGEFEIKRFYQQNTHLIYKKNKMKYDLDFINNVIVINGKDSTKFHVISTKKYKKSKKIIKRLGVKKLTGENIELFYVPTTIHSFGFGFGFGGMMNTVASESSEAFLKRTNDKIAYNMGYLFGVGQRGIKKRVREYFTDCPKLIALVNKNKIRKKNTFAIADYYEKNCGDK